MKTKKLLALGLLSAMTVTSLSGTSVFAAENPMEGTGATNVEYTPGRSTGGDGEGNVSSWTIDYPVKITLSDATVDADSGVDVNFKVINTNGGAGYSGEATIKATLGDHVNKTNDNQAIKMFDSANTLKDNVTMQLAQTNATIIKTDGSGEFATLNKTTKNHTLKAYLKDNSGAENKKTYKTTLTWVFESARVN